MTRRMALAGLVAAILPASAFAAATPDPQVLKTALVEAPSSDYVEADSSTKGEGAFDASGYVDNFISDPARRPVVEARLKSLQFVSGYSRIWAKTGAGVVLIEQILAFAGESGAKSFFGSSKLADTASSELTDTFDTSSIPGSYGVEDLVNGSFKSVAVVFTKGNDLIGIAFVSQSTYLKSEVLSQSTAAYAHAPDFSIQPAPSKGAASLSAPPVALIAAGITGLLVVILLALLVVFLVMRRRRPGPQPVMTGGGAPAVVLSDDRQFWWNGSAWQPAATSAPPQAPRSPDGTQWWDGVAWRPVPKP